MILATTSGGHSTLLKLLVVTGGVVIANGFREQGRGTHHTPGAAGRWRATGFPKAPSGHTSAAAIEASVSVSRARRRASASSARRAAPRRRDRRARAAA